MPDPTKEAFDAAAQKVMKTAPDGLSREDFFARIDKELAPPEPAPETLAKSDTSSGLALAAAGKLTPAAAWEAMRFGTSPNVPKYAAKAGKVIGAVAAPIVGAVEGGPFGGLVGAAEAAKAAWAGGGTGWFTGKLAQSIARPVARGLEAAAPIADAVSKVGGVQGALDLAQMAEPNRHDIGFMGVGGTMKPLEVLQKAVANGANPASAAAALTHGDPKAFGELMTAYMKSRQVK
jgi:hypothetical protein